jgi:putative transposase
VPSGRGRCSVRIDAHARRILGWSVATRITSQLVLYANALEQAIWTRHRKAKDLASLIAHHDHGSQYLSVAYTEHLDTAGIKHSTGAVGSSYDCESVRCHQAA